MMDVYLHIIMYIFCRFKFKLYSEKTLQLISKRAVICSQAQGLNTRARAVIQGKPKSSTWLLISILGKISRRHKQL